MKRISLYLTAITLSFVVLSSTSFATEQTIIDSNNQFSARFVLKRLAYEENGVNIRLGHSSDRHNLRSY